jgi:peptidoglycan/LPS O-acetylase OafA/YrhL
VTGIDKWSILAGLRFVLASIVAFNHLKDFASLGFLGFIPMFGPFEAILGFLLISGYSISASYAKQPEGFLLRRIFRLYPIYVAAIVITCLADILMQIKLPNVTTFLINALFLNQMVTNSSFVGPAWTLSLEFWLYCLAPLLMTLSHKSTRLIVYCSFTCFAIYTMLRTLAHMPYYSGIGFGANLLFLSFIWVAGFRLARSSFEDKTALRDIAVIFCGHIALAVAIQFGSHVKRHTITLFFTGGDALAYVMQAITLLFVFLVFKYLVVAERPALKRSWFLRLLGDISYPLYLLHAALFIIFAHFGLKNPALFYLFAVLASGCVYWSFDFYSKRRHLQAALN